MPSKLVRHGRVRGYRPTADQLLEMLELAQRGIDDAGSSADLIYSQGDLEFYPKGDLKKILPSHLDEIIEESGRPDDLNNLGFSVGQAELSRNVRILIGPGDDTIYRIESDDQTWAYGRYHELTDKLLKDRSLYAKFVAAAPETLEEGTDNKWRQVAWESANDWRAALVGLITLLPYLPGAAALALTLSFLGNYYGAETKQDHQQALDIIHFMSRPHSILITTISVVTYVIAILAYRRWKKTFLRSGIMISKSSRLAQFNFRNKKADPVVLASFYVACVGVAIAAIIPFL